MSNKSIPILICSLLLCCYKTNACSCVNLENLDFREINGYDLVFYGEILAVSTNEGKWMGG